MASNFLKLSLLFVILVLLQVLVLNQISFLGYATPFLYIYFIIKLPIGINRYYATLLGFIMGFTIDVFCNTPGVNAAATTFVAFFAQSIQNLFFQREDHDSFVPSLSLLNLDFAKYMVTMVLLHHVALLLIESFSYQNIDIVLLRIVLSSALTCILILAIEGFSSKKKIV
ncbi:rod shape-determining protein MreD [Dysgonomonas sp. PH5-45]|uniref:rod shape-determining protein MreD n=1 Tax=unclassified Dysgonomonas TaxID=2630389 RepID=UPI0024749A72|nr:MULTISPECIES: rod shape-determining protein MreD [unclassified Dysgonomonas]MDH6355573.1 rod shape-determining protein MreD [Dysgonomonas sp. PH5-45]MDH6388470.1 rod shape-determining protein MreD [Dysgonomonas sp. PH5-37]